MMMRRRLTNVTSSLALGLALAAAPRAARAEDWPAFSAALGRGAGPLETIGAGFAAQPGWSHALPDVQAALYHSLVASPAVADGTVVFATYDHRVRALRETDGALQWEARLSDAILASPTVRAGRVYVLSTDGWLTALALADGAPVWTRDLATTAYGAVAATADGVWVVTGNPTPRVLRLDAETGTPLWTAGEGVLGQALHSSPAVARGHVIVGEMNGKWRSFAAADGALEWTAETPGTVQMSSPLVVGDRVYVAVGGAAAKVHAFELGTGSAVPGWPVEIVFPAETAAGKPTQTKVVTSSPVAVGADRLALVARRDITLKQTAVDLPDTAAMTELVVGVSSGATPTLLWTAALAHGVSADGSVPPYGLAATPAVFSDGADHLTLAVPSALESQVTYIDGLSGAVRGTAASPGPTRSSPAAANAGLFLATDAGVVVRWASTGNRAPAAPAAGFSPRDGALVTTHEARLGWSAAAEPDGDAVTYVVRWDDDGEILHDWDGEVVTEADEPSAALAGLAGDRTYSWAVRARDARGALSPWSALRKFVSVATPKIAIGDREFDTLDAAFASAAVGDTVSVGAGRLILNHAATVPPGVTLAGAAPHLTILDGRDLDAAIVLTDGARSDVRLLTVTGARVGVRADGGTHELRNVIVRDDADAGIRVAAAATVDVVSATILRNGVGVDVLGTARLRNAIVTRNRVGVAAAEAGRLATAFSNVFANGEVERRLVDGGQGDFTALVTFLDEESSDLRLPPAQATTDRGDPSDPFGAEPAPNGGRINLGAFGNTPYAELTGLGGEALGGNARAGAPAAESPAQPDAPQASSDGGGCGCDLGQPGGNAGGALLLLCAATFVASRRRVR
jgi:hypothetical protein